MIKLEALAIAKHIAVRRMTLINNEFDLPIVGFLSLVRESVNLPRLMEQKELVNFWVNHIDKYPSVVRFLLEGSSEFFTLMGYTHSEMEKEAIRLGELLSYNNETSYSDDKDITSVLEKTIREEILPVRQAGLLVKANPWFVWVVALAYAGIPLPERK